MIAAAVQAVEKLVAKPGPQKQDAALELVAELLPLVEASVGRELLDDADVQAAVRAAIDAVVRLNNVITATCVRPRADVPKEPR
jgi:hypothetical protein